MRITQKTIFSDFMRDINLNRSQMAEIQSDLSSGHSVRLPSQDPISFQQSRRIQEDISRAEQYQSNISSGLRQGRVAQQVLDDSIDELIKMKEIAVQGATDSLDDQDREDLADEIAGIRENIISNLNKSYGDRYLFAGTNSDTQPFVLVPPATVNNNSNNTNPSVVADEGVTIDISVNGQDLAATGAGDLFQIIGNIEQELRNNNPTAVNNLLPQADEAIDHVTDAASKLGDNLSRLDFMFEQYESTKITQKDDVSELIDTDYAEAFSKLQRNQVAYESAMAVHTTMFENTLLDYI